MSGGLSSSHVPGARIELDDLQRVGRRPVDVALAGGVQAAPGAHVHLQAVRAQRRDVVEEHDPLRLLAPRLLEALARDLLAARARDLAVAMAEGRVAHRLEVHEGPHRGRVARRRRRSRARGAPPRRSRARPRCGRRPARRPPPAPSSGTARTWPRRPSPSGRRAPRRAATPRRRPRGPPASGRYTVQVLSWKARSRQAVSAASRTSSGWKGVTPSMRKSSGKP